MSNTDKKWVKNIFTISQFDGYAVLCHARLSSVLLFVFSLCCFLFSSYFVAVYVLVRNVFLSFTHFNFDFDNWINFINCVHTTHTHCYVHQRDEIDAAGSLGVTMSTETWTKLSSVFWNTFINEMSLRVRSPHWSHRRVNILLYRNLWKWW